MKTYRFYKVKNNSDWVKVAGLPGREVGAG